MHHHIKTSIIGIKIKNNMRFYLVLINRPICEHPDFVNLLQCSVVYEQG